MNSNIPEIFNWNRQSHPRFPLEQALPVPTQPQLLAVEVDDESLRDGLQGTRLYPNAEQSQRYIDLGVEIGLKIFTVGIYTPEYTLPNAITRHILAHMRDQYPHTIPVVLCRTLKPDVQYAEECVSINPRTQVIVFQGASPIRMFAQGWEKDKVLKGLSACISYLAKQNIQVISFTEDTTRTPPEFIEELARMSVDCGATRFGIADTTGYLDPWGTMRIVHAVRQMLDSLGPDGSAMGVEFHGHRDRGLDVPNALAAISGGADRIHGVVYGVGERAGNTSLEILLYNFNRLLQDSGYQECRWNLLPIYELVQLYETITGTVIPDHLPLVGANAFSTKAGIHADAEEKALMKLEEVNSYPNDGCERENLLQSLSYIAACVYSSVDSRTIGRSHGYNLGPMCGYSTVRMWLRHHGYTVRLGDDHDPRVQKLFRVASQSDHVLSDSEIEKILSEEEV